MEELGVGKRRQQGRRLSAQKGMTPWTLRELRKCEKDALHVRGICQVFTLRNGLRHSEHYSNGLKHLKGDVFAQ